MRIVLLFILLVICTPSFAQQDSLKPEKNKSKSSRKAVHHPPQLAAVMSLCVPGLGQAYNKKFWKIPIIWAGLGTTLYFFNQNNTMAKQYKEAYVKRDTAHAFSFYFPSSDDNNTYSLTQLQEKEKISKKSRDFYFLLSILFYTINVADAYVDAHLMTFDVNDNLSLQVSPSFNMVSYHSNMSIKQHASAGLTFSFKF